MDATHVKAHANGKKVQKRIAKEEALFYEELLKKEINEDRQSHGKKPLKDKEDDSSPPDTGSGCSGEKEPPTQKCSTTDSESGWFRKGEHKHGFAYAIETACEGLCPESCLSYLMNILRKMILTGKTPSEFAI